MPESHPSTFLVSIRVQETGFRRWEIARILESIAVRLQKIPGCLSCELLEDLMGEGTLVLQELWTSRKAAQGHLDSKPVEEIRKLTRSVEAIFELRRVEEEPES